MIIVTGAAGFIGSNIIADLQTTKHGPIVAIDWLGNENKWLNLAKHHISAFVAPEKTLSFLTENASQIEYIIHMGAISATTEKNVDALVEQNINYSVMLWDWCTQHKVPFIYASSAATYGADENILKDNNDFQALSKLHPLNPYGWSKKTTDLIFAERAAQGITPPQWVGLKFFNVYGPNEYHKGEMRSVIAKFFDDIKTWGAVKLFKSDRPDIEDGQQQRDFVYVKDCTQAILWFMEHRDTSGIFNIGTGQPRSFLDLVKIMEQVIDQPVEITFKDMPEELKSRYQYRTQADMTKAQTAGLNINFHSLEAGITDYIKNYLATNDIYR